MNRLRCSFPATVGRQPQPTDVGTAFLGGDSSVSVCESSRRRFLTRTSELDPDPDPDPNFGPDPGLGSGSDCVPYPDPDTVWPTLFHRLDPVWTGFSVILYF